MKKIKHSLNGCITVLPEGGQWIASRYSSSVTRLEFLDHEVDTLDTLSDWFRISGRIAGAHTSRILDAGVVFDIDGKPPAKPLLYIESTLQSGLTLNELVEMGSCSELISRLLFRVAFSLKCLGTAFCGHGALSPSTVFFSPESTVLPHPRSAPRSKPIDPLNEFKAFVSLAGLIGKPTDKATRFLEKATVPEMEEAWTGLFHPEPTSWLLGFEEKLSLLLRSVSFADMNDYGGVNVVGRMDWGASTLAQDFCISRRLEGKHVIEVAHNDHESEYSTLSILASHVNQDPNATISRIISISKGAQVDLVINTLNNSDNTETEQMISDVIKMAGKGKINIIVFSDRSIDCADLFRITLPFEKAGKRGLLSRITSRRMDRTPEFFGNWLSSFEYYQLITNCKGNRALNKGNNHCASSSTALTSTPSVPILQGCSADSILFGSPGEYHYRTLLTGADPNLSIWEPEQSANVVRQKSDILREHMLTNGCKNLRELEWALRNSSISVITRSLLLENYFLDTEDLISIEEKLGFIGSIALSEIDCETAIYLTEMIGSITDLRGYSVLNLSSEARILSLKVINAIERHDVPEETHLILGLLKLCSLEPALLFAEAVAYCRRCVELRKLNLAVIACSGMFAPPAGLDDFEKGLKILADLKSIADTDEQRWMFDISTALLSIRMRKETEKMHILLSHLSLPDPVKFPWIFTLQKTIETIEAIQNEVISTSDLKKQFAEVQLISTLSGFEKVAYTAMLNEVTLCWHRSSMSAWEVEESIHKLTSRLHEKEDWIQPIQELALLLGTNMQQMNLTRSESYLDQLLDCWNSEIKAIRDGYKTFDSNDFGGIELEIILLGLATGDLDSLWRRLKLIGLGHLKPEDTKNISIISTFSQSNLPYQAFPNLISPQAVILHASRTRMESTELKARLASLKAVCTDNFLQSLRSGDLLGAYLFLIRIAASPDTGWHSDLSGHLKVIRALERRYRIAGLPLIDGSTPFQIIAGADWEDSLSVPRVRGELHVPDSLFNLRKLLVCDAIWLFELGPWGSSLLDSVAPVHFTHDVSWLRSAIRKMKHAKPYDVIDAPGDGWAVGHSIPATASVKFLAERSNPVVFRILVAESICPGMALTKRQKALLSSYAKVLYGEVLP